MAGAGGWLRARGWAAVWRAASQTKDLGRSGGTVVLVRCNVGVSGTGWATEGALSSADGGRVSHAHVWAGFKGGFGAASVYLKDGEGMSDTNRAILRDVGRALDEVP